MNAGWYAAGQIEGDARIPVVGISQISRISWESENLCKPRTNTSSFPPGNTSPSNDWVYDTILMNGVSYYACLLSSPESTPVLEVKVAGRPAGGPGDMKFDFSFASTTL